jgi:hypothetical protein
MSRGARTRPSTLVGAWVGNGLVTNLGDFESIATTTVGSGGSSTITFSDIPQTYKHLQIRGIARTATTTQDFLVYKPNNANLSARHFLSGDGATASSGGSTTVFDFGQIPKSNDTASVFSVFVMDLLDYNNTSKFKTIRHLAGYDLNGSGQTILASGYYGSTTAVTSLVITTYNSTNFAQYSSFALYGIKG